MIRKIFLDAILFLYILIYYTQLLIQLTNILLIRFYFVSKRTVFNKIINISRFGFLQLL
ncbi:protein of unknown function [Sterolibacterium denitrificans]|uniref:Uncharacterized protein n=1 Tax=Sterolibacterium denitrificans TaxID=157592 RepID=A0A7Z7HPL1_9PROT|nr:protein of unknown function [Sterolibacterium denitrificans]